MRFICRIKEEMKILFVLVVAMMVGCFGYCQTAEDYYNMGNAKFKLQDYLGAIDDYTCAIEINSDYLDCLIMRGNSRDSIEYYNGAISDYTKAIELNPKNADYYFYRGSSKEKLQHNNGAINDFTTAIEINPNNANYYYKRGLIRASLGQNVCVDFNKAARLHHTEAIEFVKKYCN